MSRRTSLPGADELFRRTSSSSQGEDRKAPESTQEEKSINLQAPPAQEDKSTNLRVADAGAPVERGKSGPRHDEKITFYCTGDDLLALERVRLALRADFNFPADRGRIVRAAVSYVLEDFAARQGDSVLLRELRAQER